jgi:hypothetical protein
MAFKRQSTSGVAGQKTYFWRSADWGNGMSLWSYVTADADTTVETSFYFPTTEADLLVNLKVGDLIRVIRVGAIDDTRTIQEDMAATLVDESWHIVLNVDSAAGINISQDILAATVTYTS